MPLEDLLGALRELQEAGYIRHIGLSEVRADTLRKAQSICPIHTVEVQYSLASRGIEKELIPTAKELGVKVLCFGALAHGLISERILNDDHAMPHFAPSNLTEARKLVSNLKTIADEKGVSVSDLALLWTMAKYPGVSSLIGTTNPDHLRESVKALRLTLTEEDVARIEAAFPEDALQGFSMRTMRFVDGKMLF